MRGVHQLVLIFLSLSLFMATEAKRKSKQEDYVSVMSDEDVNYDEEIENEEELEPCQCGVFLSQQVGLKEGRRSRPRGPPQGEPVVTYDTDSPSLPCGSGLRNCISRCLDVILNYLPRAGPVICGAVERDVDREKAFLFIRNCGGEWTPTSFSAGKEFCCTNGEHHKC
ncbi:unnamed protein product [Arctia plantaginis]|uniref:Follicle cell protein 3C-1 n=1 Tax=Arctia plantaginis TaxID=874455 RepID=A0A8S0ZXR1_ARCPL|nr:unnamed protein product [Arctia plantaginis]CAB3237483.1 unnamed protein product [Arctia plantaginis]